MNDHVTVQQLDSARVAAKAAAQDGRLAEAHRLFAELTEQVPDDVEAWLWLAATAPTPEESLRILNEALALDPRHAATQRAVYETLQRRLRQDAFLAYAGESDVLYQTHTAGGTPVLVPKKRAVPRPYPPAKVEPLQQASRWLVLAFFGLLPSGLGALLFAPIALFSTLRLDATALGRDDQKRRRIFIAAALLLWVLGLSLGLLVLVHL